MDRNAFSKLLVAVGVVWLGYWLYLGRYSQLDDAFIHLRYARNLRTYGFLTFDAVHPSTGCSSLLYVGLLSLIPGLMSTIHATKALSVAGYLSLLAAVLWMRRNTPEAAMALWSLFVTVLASPMAFRWLTDGMETSLVLLFSALLATGAYSTSLTPTLSAHRYLILLALGYGVVTLRIDSSVLLLTGSMGAWVLSVERRVAADGFRPRLWDMLKVFVRESHVATGGLLGVATIYFMTGHVLPDSAVAKASGRPDISQLWGVARAFFASFSLGVGLLAIWALSLAVLIGVPSVRKYHRGSLVLANSPLLVYAVGTAVRGQAVHGVRYFLGPLIFTIVWDLQMLSSGITLSDMIHHYLNLVKTRGKVVLAPTLTVLALAWLLEGSVVGRIFGDEAATLLAMRSQHLETLADKPGVAFDVGLISLFSGGRICDLSGLVNGRQMAQDTTEHRAIYCARRAPAFAYLTPSQAGFFKGFMNLDSWYVCHEYWESNVGTREPHYLLVRPDFAGMCPKPALIPRVSL